MKLRKGIRCASIVVVALLLASCQVQQSKQTESAIQAKVQIVYQKNLISRQRQPFQVIDPKMEKEKNLETISIQTDQDISDIELVEVEMGEVNDQIVSYYKKRVIYQQAFLGKDDTLLFSTKFSNDTPHFAFAYTDVDGQKQVYSIAVDKDKLEVITSKAYFLASLEMNYMSFDSMEQTACEDNIVDPRFQNSEYVIPVYIATDEPIFQFKILDVSLGQTIDDITYYHANKVIYELAELTPRMPLIFQTEFPGLIPIRVISYLDLDGKEKTYSISMSEKDGSLIVERVYLDNQL